VAAEGQQGSPDSQPPPTPPHTGIRALLKGVADDFASLPTSDNLVWGAFGGTLTLVVHPIDAEVNQHLVGNPDVDRFFAPGKALGQGPLQVAAAFGIFAYGRVAHRPKVSHVGMDLIRAQIVAGALTYGLKVAVRRERPDGSDNMSFPSGHASVTFATALVLQRHFGWWALPTVVVASYTAASRLHENVHYLSDVVAGATIGAIAGRTVTRHGRTHFTLVPVVSRGRVALLLQRDPGR
jgi:membrane-associated phospholipid phosphatase